MDNKKLSFMFYNYLCDVIGSDEVVHRRRDLFAALEKSRYNTFPAMFSGSRAEGLDLKGSDLDVMFIFNCFPVYETYNDPRYFHNCMSMIVDVSDTKPGFINLKAHHNSSILTGCWKQMKSGYYLSNKLFRECFESMSVGFITHGPCLTTPDKSIDIAMSFRCSDWILPAQPWLTRSRYSWAADEVLNQMVNFGVLFVPIGSKNSPTEDIEWRISFSAAEKLLVWSFNHVQFLCYALLKILLNDVIKKQHGDLLCSYFLKTIMFWICEETLKDQWRPENIITCFMSCLKRLVYSVEHKTCLHYFIPVNNFFEDRFDVKEHNFLLLTLNSLLQSGWLCLLYTKTLSSFRRWCLPSLSQGVLTVSYISSFAFIISIKLWLNMILTNQNERLLKRWIYSALQVEKGKYFYIYNLSGDCQQYAEITLRKMSCKQTNKDRYNCYREGLFYLLLGTNHDAVSGWLLLASFFYRNKQYQICEHLLRHCLSECTNEKCLVSRDVESKYEHRFKMAQTTHRLSLLTACKTFSIIDYVQFFKHSTILADEFKVNLTFGFVKCFETVEFVNILDSALRRRNRYN